MQNGKRWEIGTVGMRAAGGNAEILACRGDFGERDPGGLVRGASKIKRVAVTGISRKRRYGERRILWHTALSTGSGRKAGLVAPRRYHLQTISYSFIHTF